MKGKDFPFMACMKRTVSFCGLDELKRSVDGGGGVRGDGPFVHR
jgi:hypothetical protein